MLCSGTDVYVAAPEGWGNREGSVYCIPSHNTSLRAVVVVLHTL